MRFPFWFICEREQSLNLLCDSIGKSLTDHEYQEFVRHEVPKWRKLLNAEYEPPVRKTPNKSGTITDEMITRAREYDISLLFPEALKNGMVRCPFHGEDRRPSASIKKGRFVCFACGEKQDVIGVFQRLNSCDFQTAVKALQ